MGDDAVRELKAMILERIEREVRALDGLKPEPRAAKAQALRDFADAADIDIRHALRRPVRPPARSALSREAQRAPKAIDEGIPSRAVAEEILGQYPSYIETRGWVFREVNGIRSTSYRG